MLEADYRWLTTAMLLLWHVSSVSQHLPAHLTLFVKHSYYGPGVQDCEQE